MRKTIVHLIATLSVGGAEKQLIYMLNALAESKNYDLHLIVLRNIDDLSSQLDASILVHRIGVRSVFSLGAWFRFIFLLRSLSPFILHSQLFNANIIARLCSLVLPSTKIINHIHGLGENYSILRKLIDKASLRLCDKIITVSQKSAELRVDRDGYEADKITVLYNGIDVPNFQLSLKRNEKNVLILGTAARLIPLKRIDLMIDIVKYINDQDVNCELHLAGKGKHGECLKKYAKDQGLMDKIKFVGFVSDLSIFYNEIDIFILTSETEDLPVSIIEAMSYGRAIVATNVGGVSELLEEAVSHTFNLPMLEYEKRKVMDFCIQNSTYNHIKNRNKVISMFSKDQYLVKVNELYS